MDLIAAAKKAERFADALKKFKDPVPEAATDITDQVAELYAIGHALRDLDTSIFSPDGRRNFDLVREDLDLVLESLDYTLSDIFVKLGSLANGSPVVTSSQYASLWRDICRYFNSESRLSLITRLKLYRTLLQQLGLKMKRSLGRPDIMEPLRRDLDDLLLDQNPPNRLVRQVNNLSLRPSGRPARRSFERPRPPNPPQSPMSPNAGTPPWAPEVSEASTATSTYSSSTSETVDAHWATVVTRDMSATPLRGEAAGPACYGDPNPDAKRLLNDEYELVFAMAFGRKLEVELYVRDPDKRARILCKSPKQNLSGYRFYCLPLNTLLFKRQARTLQLCRRANHRTTVELWAILQFSTIERLVVFFCTLIALRAQDAGRPIHNLGDFDLKDEEECFGGLIEDDGYQHALRVFRDTHSKAIRIQASVMTGEMKNTPVWTAFIHHHLRSRSWLARASPRTLLLRDLRRHVFSSRYTPDITARGEHILAFKSDADANGFFATIKDLAQLQN